MMWWQFAPSHSARFPITVIKWQGYDAASSFGLHMKTLRGRLIPQKLTFSRWITSTACASDSCRCNFQSATQAYLWKKTRAVEPLNFRLPVRILLYWATGEPWGLVHWKNNIRFLLFDCGQIELKTELWLHLQECNCQSSQRQQQQMEVSSSHVGHFIIKLYSLGRSVGK